MNFRALLICIALTLVSATGFAADNGTITLRLDDGQSAQTQAAPASDTVEAPRLVIDVPAKQTKPGPMPDVKGASAVLMDAATGQVLYAKNPHVRRPNASTTKIMTAILIMEHCGLSDTITASKKASETPFTSLHLKPGEKMSVLDLLTGMLIRSANDAAVAAAEHIAGSVPKFAVMMNKKAAEIGCKDTHFVTPNGLHAPGHYSTAYDLCLMARYAQRYPLFNDIVRTRKYALTSRSMNKKDLVVFSRCKFLRNYPGADGVKSGYVRQAGYCYVGSATRNGWRLVSAVLKSDNAGRDTAAIMNYGFANFEPVSVARANTGCATVDVRNGAVATIAAVPARDLTVVVPKTGARIVTRVDLTPVVAPITAGTKVGTIKALVNGTEVAKVDLRASQDVGVSFASRAIHGMKICGLMAAFLLVGGKYGRAFTKSSRRRGRSVTSPLRNFNNYR
ncbi:MAG: D-alanyl-D-alanine carboxypeptidase [Armatimonadetes bacterium]|nr:D-alanyl-D-alanine carboxypeptidase [Armatimonadota bacterium]